MAAEASSCRYRPSYTGETVMLAPSGALIEVMRSTEQSVCSSLRSTSRICSDPTRAPKESSSALICPDCDEQFLLKLCWLLALSLFCSCCFDCLVSILFHWILMTLVDSWGFHTLPLTTSLSTTRRWLVRNTSCDVALMSSSEPNCAPSSSAAHTLT